jgi:hypothetical protein
MLGLFRDEVAPCPGGETAFARGCPRGVLALTTPPPRARGRRRTPSRARGNQGTGVERPGPMSRPPLHAVPPRRVRQPAETRPVRTLAAGLREHPRQRRPVTAPMFGLRGKAPVVVVVGPNPTVRPARSACRSASNRPSRPAPSAPTTCGAACASARSPWRPCYPASLPPPPSCPARPIPVAVIAQKELPHAAATGIHTWQTASCETPAACRNRHTAPSRHLGGKKVIGGRCVTGAVASRDSHRRTALPPWLK